MHYGVRAKRKLREEKEIQEVEGKDLEERKRMRKIILKLEKKFPDVRPFHNTEAFPVLIRTILSQNTSEINTTRAYQSLSENYEIKPEILSNLDPNEIKPLIKPAGLQEIRSRRIVEVSINVVEKFNGDLYEVLRTPIEEARQTLMSLKGVGYKTADILLCFVGRRPIFPIDTNIFRIVNRIGFVSGRDYERVRIVLEKLIPPKKIPKAHLLFIRHGREICKSRRPLHDVCPIRHLCDKFKERI